MEYEDDLSQTNPSAFFFTHLKKLPMFYTSKLIKQTEKSLCILEMIQKANNRIESYRADIYQYVNTKDCFAPIRLMWNLEKLEARQRNMEKVAERLVRYYVNTMSEIVEQCITRSENVLLTSK